MPAWKDLCREAEEILRPTLRLRDTLRIDDRFGLHPAMTGLHRLLEDRSLCVVHGVGYPNPSQSHFRSMDIWQAASSAPTLTEGWLGKALKKLPAVQSFHLSGTNESAPLALAGAPVRVPSVTSLEDFQLRIAASSSSDKKEQRSIIESAVMPPVSLSRGESHKTSLLDFVQRVHKFQVQSSKHKAQVVL